MPTFLHIAGAILVGVFLPVIAHAQIEVCGSVPGLSCAGGGQEAVYLNSTLIRGALIALSGVLFGMIVFYGLRLVFGSHDENAITEARVAFGYAFFGVILVGGAYFIADSLTTGGGIDVGPTQQGVIGPTVRYMRNILFIVVVMNVFLQAVRLILSRGEEGEVEKSKKRLILAFMGAGVIILASLVVEAFRDVQDGILAEETVGIANFLGTIFGILAVVAVIVGGAMWVLSVQDDLKEKGKQLIIAALVSIVVVSAAYAIVRVFIF